MRATLDSVDIGSTQAKCQTQRDWLSEVLRMQGKELDELSREEAGELVDKKAAQVAAKGQGSRGGRKKTQKRDSWNADGFQAFSIQRKKELSSKGDSIKESALAAKLANEWLDLPEKAREDFVKADDKAKNKAEKKKARTSTDTGKSDSKAKVLTGYNLFCKERRQELKASGRSKDMKPTEVMKLLGAEWQTQSEQQKQHFKEKAQQV